jgi:hypothetical protein
MLQVAHALNRQLVIPREIYDLGHSHEMRHLLKCRHPCWSQRVQRLHLFLRLLPGVKLKAGGHWLLLPLRKRNQSLHLLVDVL